MTCIFRHGQTLWNLEHRLQGWKGSPLTELGIEQVLKVADHYREHHHIEGLQVDLYSSDLERSVNSSRLFQEYIQVHNWTQAMSLREFNWGIHEGRTHEEAKDVIEARNANKFLYKVEGGEAYAEVYDRVSRFLDHERIRYDDPGKIVIFHVHQVVSKVLRGLLLGLSPSNFMDLDHTNDQYFIIHNRICKEINL